MTARSLGVGRLHIRESDVLADPANCLLGGAPIRGVNLTVSEAQITAGSPYRALFAAWDWAGQIKPQVDLAKAAGANTIRLIGDIQGVNDGTFTASYYHACWGQLIDYAATLGMRTYPAGGGTSQVGSLTVTQVSNTLAALATYLQTKGTAVVGLDLLQESNAYALTNGATVTAAVRAAAPSVKLTWSHNPLDDAATIATGWRTGIRSFVDFLDLHIYFNPRLWLLYDAMWAKGETLPILIGEYGRSVAAGQAGQEARFDAVAAMCNKRTLGLRPAGALVWAAWDESSSVTTSQFGIYDLASQPRQYLIDRFRQLPVV